MTPEREAELRARHMYDCTPSVIDECLNEIAKLRAEVEELKAGHFDVILDIAKERDAQCVKLKTLEEFALEIRDGFDCDTGANGVHAYRCRCCVAEELLGLPPHPAKDQRTMGG